MQQIVDKMVYSLSAPTNKNVVWIKPTGNNTFEMRIYDNNTWVPLSSSGSGGSGGSGSGIDIVDSVDKLDPNAEVGSIASVAVQGNLVETSIRNLYQPDASMLDPDVGILTKPELLSSVSSIKVFAPTDVTNTGFEPVEASFYLVPRDFSMQNGSAAVIQVFDGGVVGMIIEGEPDITQELVLVEYDPYNDSFLVHNDQVEAFNAILANGMDWCYFGDPEGGFVITEEQFNTLDLFVNVVAGMPTIADVYVKGGKWELPHKKDLEKLVRDLEAYKENVDSSKADKITCAYYDSNYGLQPNVYTEYSVVTTDRVLISLATIYDTSVYHEYILELKCTSTPSNVSFTDSYSTTLDIKWANDNIPTFEAGYTYIISIVNNFGVFAQFTNS